MKKNAQLTAPNIYHLPTPLWKIGKMGKTVRGGGGGKKNGKPENGVRLPKQFHPHMPRYTQI